MAGADKQVIVRIRSDLFNIPYQDAAQLLLPPEALAAWQQLVALFPGVSLALNRPVSLSQAELNDLLQQASSRSGQEAPDLTRFMAIDAAGIVDGQALAAAAAALPFVDLAYEESPHTLAALTPGDDPLTLVQGYFGAAPNGIDAVHAWTLADGHGADVRFMDIEWGWDLAHEDLIGASITPLNQSVPGQEAHSTACLGIVLAQDNTVGIVGAAPNVKAFIVSEFVQTGLGVRQSLPDALSFAAGTLSAGDVLLIEQQTPDGNPVEVGPFVGLFLRTMMLMGFIVIEPAGNGAHDLDQLTLPDGSGLNRLNDNFFDSGVILVAARQALSDKRLPMSCFGSRVDCHAWGEGIVTTSTTPSLAGPYTGMPGGALPFGGTSGASAIVAGAAVILQSLAKAKGTLITPDRMRDLLSNTQFNTPPDPITAVTEPIGCMPDLKELIQQI